MSKSLCSYLGFKFGSTQCNLGQGGLDGRSAAE